MSAILTGLDGVVCMIDDVLVHGRTQEEHDCRLAAVLERIRKAGVTLNGEKCEFLKQVRSVPGPGRGWSRHQAGC